MFVVLTGPDAVLDAQPVLKRLERLSDPAGCTGVADHPLQFGGPDVEQFMRQGGCVGVLEQLQQGLAVLKERDGPAGVLIEAVLLTFLGDIVQLAALIRRPVGTV